MFAATAHPQTLHALPRRLKEVRARTDAFFELLHPDAWYARPIAERNRFIFYLGHLEAFDWNLFQGRLLNARPFHAEFDQLFAFGIDPVGGGLPTDKPEDWPVMDEVLAYVRRTRELIDAGLSELGAADWTADHGEVDYNAGILLNVAIEHRLMHEETLAYMLHQLPLAQKRRQMVTPLRADAPFTPAMLRIPAGSATLGLARDETGAFGWDNEFDAHVVDVPEFEIDKYKVTNGQYLEFMRQGGYDDAAYWRADDWQWRTDNDIHQPVFWKKIGTRWMLRTMFDEIPLPEDWPVYVSHAEAGAYARWAGKALPTEAQWHRAAYGTPRGEQRAYPWGAGPPSAGLGNFDFHHWDPAPVHALPAGDSAWGVADMTGNGWEWTATLFGPFAGFKPFSFYPGYSADFFDGKHYVMKGGSPRTAACMLRRSFRNWFQAHYPYIYSGFRCVNDPSRRNA